MLERLIRSLEASPVMKRGEYDYFIHPITDGVPLVEPALLREVGCAMVRVLDLSGVDKIVVCEAMGIHIGVAFSMMTDIPLVVVRKRSYNLPGEVAVHQTTGYSKGELYLNGVSAGERVVIIDDVCSTGGTLRALISALGQVGAEIADICVVISRGDADIGRPLKTLVRVDVSGGRVRVVDTCI
ncbi:purine phosphoribosyltransferase family protein [Methanoculleus bourgensis]|jgi:adenine phosphoribosyltransferase|uniref:Hypoxanthine/guanine phosphoribosyltransferase n=2 Tax=Methanoculleus bourgensis TaxID=83986 RepID=A0A0X3BIA3_9EURY|nr:hypoxanthine/guanine phosphoribosyltransferase [Methanoculleus bourgensis]MBT0733822.1 purine phosphoribosyltransferase family protein [Methanoculleus bourgensis]MDD3372857.1 hypoxanthine/guanine phosphoribosyltransferase [Methanoculleus bourgensis]NMA89072.1 purine phosphoribosyltransferase family protein [Methanoculleus bourgensis]NQS77461.1 purine phosphoribosyltransferase family protein [Methanoculleus bourgensis]CCJ35465.1 adenine phosphoribosyltransferase [Methanoculleus bourgensis MS